MSRVEQRHEIDTLRAQLEEMQRDRDSWKELANRLSDERVTLADRMQTALFSSDSSRADFLQQELKKAEAGIKLVFDMIEHGDLDVRHVPPCPLDDTCDCRVRRFLLELQRVGGSDVQSQYADECLAKLPGRSQHDRPDCPCDHPLGTYGVCAGCNCADEAP